MSALIQRSWGGAVIRQRGDSWLALTDMDAVGAQAARAEGRPVVRLDNWLQRPAVKAFLVELERTLDPRVRAIEAERGGPGAGGVTWGEPRLAHLFAIDISPAFALRVTSWIEELRVNGVVDLRRGAAPVLDLDDPNALRGLIEALALRRSQDQALIAQQAAQIAVAAPTLEAHAALVRAEGDVGLQDAGRILRRGANKFTAEMIRDGILFRGAHNKPTPYAEFLERGYFRLVETEADGHVWKQTMVTPRGMDFLARRYPATDKGAPGSALVSTAYLMAGKGGH